MKICFTNIRKYILVISLISLIALSISFNLRQNLVNESHTYASSMSFSMSKTLVSYYSNSTSSTDNIVCFSYLITFFPIIMIVIIASVVRVVVARRVRQYPNSYQQNHYMYQQQPFYPYQPAYQQPVYQQQPTVIIREIVKIPCKYCGCLIPEESISCPFCGAPLSR